MHQEQAYYTAVNTIGLVHDEFLFGIQVVSYVVLLLGLIVFGVYNARKAQRPWKHVARRSLPWLVVAIAMIGFPSPLPFAFDGVAYLVAAALAPALNQVFSLLASVAPYESVFAGALVDLIIYAVLLVVPMVLTVTLPKKRDEEEDDEEQQGATQSYDTPAQPA